MPSTESSSGQPNSKPPDDADGSRRNLHRVVFVLGLCIVLGVIAIFWKMGTHAGTSLVWALACLMVGALVGFLFGIPRVEQFVPSNPGATPARAAPAADELVGTNYRQRVNTNLEQISDWLTKIIVGLGLIELRNFPGYLQSIAAYQAECAGTESCPAFAGALVVYFALVGFFTGYLLTRLFLSRAFAIEDQFADQIGQLRQLYGKVEDEVRTTRKAIVEGVGQKVPTPAAGLAPIPPAAEPDADPTDIQKGKWGGQSEANGRKLSARVRPTDDQGTWFEIELEVRSTDAGRPLTGTVTFHLHQTFRDRDPVVPVADGVARTSVLAYGAFTVGAEADGGVTHLELDLSTLPDSPQAFREG